MRHWAPYQRWITQNATRKLSNGKTPGSDFIPAHVCKHGGKKIISCSSSSDSISIICVNKRTENYQRRPLPCCRVLLNLHNVHIENCLIPKDECGLWKEGMAVDVALVTQEFRGTCWVQVADQYSTYGDLTKASASRNFLW